jgi:hypothetical protein
LQENGTQDDSSKYVTFQTNRSQYVGDLSFVLPSNPPASMVSSVSLLVNYKSNTSGNQTWSIYDWSSRSWVQLGTIRTNRRDSQWRTVELQIQNARQYISASNEIRIQLRLSNTKGDVNIDYAVLKVTYGSSLPSPTLIAPTATFMPMFTATATAAPSQTLTP